MTPNRQNIFTYYDFELNLTKLPNFSLKISIFETDRIRTKNWQLLTKKGIIFVKMVMFHQKMKNFWVKYTDFEI